MHTLASLKNNSRDLPQSPGVYIFKSDQKEILYIGKAKNLRNRIRSYLLSPLGEKTLNMLEKAAQLDYILVDSEFEALLLEAKLINKFKPHYNIVSKDDKSPLYIVITTDHFPRVRATRLHDIEYGDKKYRTIFGPFPSGTSVRYVLRKLRKIFPYCETKSDYGKPCPHSHIGLCNPCPRAITKSHDPNQSKQYLRNIRNLKLVLSGKFPKLKRDLTRSMLDYSQRQEYEQASRLRDQIKQLEFLTQPSRNVDEYLLNPNLLEDRAKESLIELKNLLNLNVLPVRIECYDISHLGKKYATASMVVAIDGIPKHTEYKHFKIKRASIPNDVAALHEVLARRVTHPDWGVPHLIILDGGLPQLSTIHQLLTTLGENSPFASIPAISIAKKFEQIYTTQSHRPITLELSNPALQLIVKLRNESHRFARKLHHRLHTKKIKS